MFQETGFFDGNFTHRKRNAEKKAQKKRLLSKTNARWIASVPACT